MSIAEAAMVGRTMREVGEIDFLEAQSLTLTSSTTFLLPRECWMVLIPCDM